MQQWSKASHTAGLSSPNGSAGEQTFCEKLLHGNQVPREHRVHHFDQSVQRDGDMYCSIHVYLPQPPKELSDFGVHKSDSNVIVDEADSTERQRVRSWPTVVPQLFLSTCVKEVAIDVLP